LGPGFEIGLEDDDDVKPIRETFVPHGQLIDSRLDASQHRFFFEILLWDVVIVKFVAIFFRGSPFLLRASIGKIEGRIRAQFANQV